MEKHVILYADDDNDDLTIVRDVFESLSSVIEIQTVNDGTEVIAFLKTNVPLPCLIVLDINMPKLGGVETLLEIKKIQKYKHVPVIFFTTSSSPLLISDTPSIIKPSDMEEYNSIPARFLSHCANIVRDEIIQLLSPNLKS